MYIKHIELNNIKCFKELKIDFETPGSSIVISGDNGEGKSTILRAIAMGLTDQTSASALLRDLPGDLVKTGWKKEGYIKILLSENGNEYEILTIIRSLEIFEKVEQKLFRHTRTGGKKEITNPDRFPWEKIFISGYGAGIRTNGTADYHYYTSPDAVYPLFIYDYPLQNPELAVRRIIDEANRRSRELSLKMKRYILGLLENLLNLNRANGEKVLLEKTGLKVKTKKWGKIDLSALGDGYRATTTLTMDLLSWWMLYLESLHGKSIYRNKTIKGIVFIDEVEQHLHPRWQRKIISLLTENFKQIQFIFSTHSPLVISGASNIDIHSLSYNKHEIKRAEGWLAEDIYIDVMGIKTSRSKSVELLVNEYERLGYKKLRGVANTSEIRHYNRLKKQLSKILPSRDPVIITSELKNLLNDIKRLQRNK